ncbi:Gaa1-like GPI transamidase component [Chiua virens]|nr:Gaa1-like GPI transamidase component [Chiua virens]
MAGYLWIALIPVLPLSQRVYIDENALQPAQVNTKWNWQNVHKADLYLHHLEGLRDRNATSEQRATFIRDEFAKLGLAGAIQNYTFVTPSANVSGVNAYALFSSPRASGSEAIVVSASWLSEVGEEPYNLRGIATVMALADFLKNYSLWAKDIIFVIGDNYLDGTYAWLNAYHGTIPPSQLYFFLHFSSLTWSLRSRHRSSRAYLPVSYGSALNIDYSGHSFSHLGVFFEGLNGRLPNQDLINSLRLISHYTGGVPLVLYDHLETKDAPQSSLLANAPEFIKRSPQLQEIEYRARNVRRHVSYQARGKPSGAHGLFHRFRIDAITLYAVPADGPHGFFALGRIIESTLRTSNNLLERLHASFFFYLLTTPGTFMKIGMFLPSAVLVGAAMIFWGLGQWVEAGWVQESPDPLQQQDKEEDSKVANAESTAVQTTQFKWRPRRRPVLPAIITILGTHVIGLLAFAMINSPWFLQNQASLLNFSLAATLAATLGIPLICSRTSRLPSLPRLLNKPSRWRLYTAYWVLAWGWLLLPTEIEGAVWNWQVLGVWFAPFVCIVYAPLVMQAGLVALSQAS